MSPNLPTVVWARFAKHRIPLSFISRGVSKTEAYALASRGAVCVFHS